MSLSTECLHSGARARDEAPAGEARLALLGLGNVGSAVAALLRDEPHCLDRAVRVVGALVRRARPDRSRLAPVTEDARAVLAAGAHVLIEVLGGLEPARTLVLDALRSGTPVVTANKSLLAAHGDELLDAARRFDTPLRYEASVIAGVPFLGTLARRPLASQATALAGILNGTCNFVLTRMSEGETCASAIAAARRLGLTEPTSSSDLDGTDAAEKLVVLLRHVAGLSVRTRDIPRIGLESVTAGDVEHARELGGALKPAAFARWNDRGVECLCGPAFLDVRDPLAALTGVANGIRLDRRRHAYLFFGGPGAGPDVTARTILDDVREVLDHRGKLDLSPPASAARVRPPVCGWYVRIRGRQLPGAADVADLLGSFSVWGRRWGAMDTRTGTGERRFLTFPCPAETIDSALRALSSAADCSAHAFPVLEKADEQDCCRE